MELAVADAGLDDVFIDDITVPAMDGHPLACFCPAGPSATPY